MQRVGWPQLRAKSCEMRFMCVCARARVASMQVCVFVCVSEEGGGGCIGVFVCRIVCACV